MAKIINIWGCIYCCNGIPLQYYSEIMGNYMNEENSDDGWWLFLELCTKVKKTQQLNDFLDLFLTIEEKKDVALRFLIVRELLKGEKTQREISQELQVSIAKITRGSNYLKTIGEDLRKFLIRKIK